MALRPGKPGASDYFFNKNGERASFTGQRISDFQAEQPTGEAPIRPGETVSEDTEGLNMVLLIQVPLKQRQPMELEAPMLDMFSATGAPAAESQRAPSDVEEAVIGHGAVRRPLHRN